MTIPPFAKHRRTFRALLLVTVPAMLLALFTGSTAYAHGAPMAPGDPGAPGPAGSGPRRQADEVEVMPGPPCGRWLGAAGPGRRPPARWACRPPSGPR